MQVEIAFKKLHGKEIAFAVRAAAVVEYETVGFVRAELEREASAFRVVPRGQSLKKANFLIFGGRSQPTTDEDVDN